MGKKSASELKAEADAISDLIKTARKRPLNFALVLGQEGVVLEAHPTKGADVMRRQAKANGGGPKGTQGTMNVTGKVIELTCEDADFPRTLGKTAKRYFKELGLSVKVAMILPDGNRIEDEDEDDDPVSDGPSVSDTPPEAPPAPVADAPSAPPVDAPDAPVADGERKAKLVARARVLVDAVRGLKEKEPERAQKLAAALNALKAELDANKLDRAEQLVVAMEKAVGAAPPSAPPPPPPAPDLEPLRAKLREEFAGLDDDYRRLLNKAVPPVTKKARQVAAMFDTEVAGTDLKKAASILALLKKFVADEVAKLPPVPMFELAQRAIRDAAGKPDPARHAKADPIAQKYPKGADAARKALDGFAATLGDLDVTPEVLANAAKQIDDLKKLKIAADAQLEKAKKMPDGPAKVEAFTLAQVDAREAAADVEKAIAFEKAARGKKALTDALTFGPLSAGSAQKLSDDAAAGLIAGFGRDPDLATTAVNATATAKYPDAVARGLGKVLDARETGFAAADGTRFADDATAAKYGADLLKMGANVGPEFFDRMPDYLASGRQHVQNPLGDFAIADKTEMAHARSVGVAGRLIGPDGKIDTQSQAAKDAIGDLLFSPFSLRKPTPAMNEHLVKTVGFLSEPANAEKANKVLGDMPDQPAGGAGTLVRRSLGKGPGEAVGKADAQKAVMAAMLKPLDQGPVGSCFSTAPARRMRETDPLAAMEAYASIAGKGKYKPAFGPEVPVVVNLPPHEDPIMRSWEYSLATSTARTAKSEEATTFKNRMDGGVAKLASGLTDVMVKRGMSKGGIGGLFAAGKEKFAGIALPGKLKKAIADGFEMTYDPTSAIVDANDGSSSTGRYILTRKGGGAEVRSKADFIAQISEIAIGLLELEPTSAEAGQVRALVGAPDFIDSVTPVLYQKNGADVRYLPWELASGGQTTAATKTLHGDKLSQKTITPGDKSKTGAERSKAILTDMMTTFADSPDKMITIRTVGMHGFNALPNDPSLAKLKEGGKDKIAENVDKHLTKPGEALRDTTIPADRAGWLFDKAVEDALAGIGDEAFRKRLATEMQKKRPTAAVTPAGLDAAMTAAANQASLICGDPVAAAKSLKSMGSASAKNVVMRDLGAPEFVVADSNWGSAEDHTFFVIAPDPVTGEPELWQKTVPPGSLRPAGKEWADAEWASIQ